MSEDARCLSENVLIPPNLPWNYSDVKLPHALAKNVARDLDDLPCVMYCDDDLHDSFGSKGPFGFGRYENGQSHANGYLPEEEESPSKLLIGTAVARRAVDPGVIELCAQIPMPSILNVPRGGSDASNGAHTLLARWREKLFQNPQQANKLSHLPFHWKKKPAFTTPDIHDEESDDGDRRATNEEKREFAALAVRKWQVSMKVGGVSTRATVFPHTRQIKPSSREKIPHNTRKVIRPMLCIASLPEEVQSGASMSVDKARQIDSTGQGFNLGSYDCRYLDSTSSQSKRSKKEKSSKQVQVGRKRIVWSNMIQGEDCSTPAQHKAIAFNSLISGKRLEPSKCIRPIEVKVGIRVDGRLLREEALEEVTVAQGRKRKHSARQSGIEGGTSRPPVVCPESRSDEDIEVALDLHFSTSTFVGSMSARNKSAQPSIVYLEHPAHQAEINSRELVSTLMKFNQKKKHKGGELVPLAAPGANHCAPLRFNFPKFACLPLEDGLVRTVCIKAGNLPPLSVHNLLLESATGKGDSGGKCSVCWGDERSGSGAVKECVECGLLAHVDCCADRGELIRTNDSVALAEDEEWICAVCKFGASSSSKPRRNARVPSRFTQDSDEATQNYGNSCNFPGPRCYLCPHSGGAMSQLGVGGQWAHEVCKVWSVSDFSEDPKVKGVPSLSNYFPKESGPLASACCALCGSGGKHDNQDNSSQFNCGLVTCAARGCHVRFHPMCALLSSKVGMEDKASKPKSSRTRKTRHSDQGEKQSEEAARIEEDKQFCKKYVLQMVHVTTNGDEQRKCIAPVAFCGLHNPNRAGEFFGRLPGGKLDGISS